MEIELVFSGSFTTVQDQGRFGFERYGVPQSGAVDWFSLRAANRLVGNPQGAAGLEFLFDGPQFIVGADCLVAVTGRGFGLLINQRYAGSWRCALAREGELVRVIATGDTGWGYLSLSGGIGAPTVMGSRSTYLRGGFGGYNGRTLQDGDRLPVEKPEKSMSAWREFAGRAIPAAFRYEYQDEVTIPVIPGPQVDTFGEIGLGVFLNSDYQIDRNSDRMGYRLSGPTIPRVIQTELISEGIAPGSIQVPANGQPIVLMSDRPTTGGYHKIATVTKTGLPLLAQARPGVGKARFKAVGLAEARQSYRERVAMMERGLREDEDD